MKNLTILLVYFALISCTKGQAFLEIDEITADNKLYIVPIRPMIEQVGSGEKLLISRPILIDDPKTIEKIINEWGKGVSQTPGFPIYKVILTKKGKIFRTLSINENLSGLFTGHGYYTFNRNLLFKHKDSFKYLDWINIQTKKLEDCKVLLNKLNQNGFIYPDFIYPSSDFRDYSGSITVKRKMISGVEDYEPIVRENFKNDKIALMNRKDVGRDSVSLTIWTAKEVIFNLPPEYALVEDWKEFENIEIEITGCKKELVESIADNLKIEVKIE